MSALSPTPSVQVPARVRSFARSGGRLTASQADALRRYGQQYILEVPRADAVRTVASDFVLDPRLAFAHPGKARPLIVEVGAGSGEALLAHAQENPAVDHLAVEVWRTAIANLVRGVAQADLHNVRIVPADASQLLRTALPVGCVDEVWVFFPDPWRKARHHKRRLVSVSFADSVARVLRGGGVWRLATDWADYAWQMRDVLEQIAAPPLGGVKSVTSQPYFRYEDAGSLPNLGADRWEVGSPGNGVDPGSPRGVFGGWAPRYAGRKLTHFERRGLAQGRTIRDLRAVRTETPWRVQAGT